MIGSCFHFGCLNYATPHTEAHSFLIMLICGNCLVVTCLLAPTLKAFKKIHLRNPEQAFPASVCMGARITERDLCLSSNSSSCHPQIRAEPCLCAEGSMLPSPRFPAVHRWLWQLCRWLQVGIAELFRTGFWCSSRCSPACLGRR